jgi:hypothetical protein
LKKKDGDWLVQQAHLKGLGFKEGSKSKVYGQRVTGNESEEKR